MSEDKEKFLSRWSRLKQHAREPPPAGPADTAGPPPELPPLDSLDINSNFKGFLHPKVDENLRRAALKKLFNDPHFNVMDGLDVYIDDYGKSEPIPAEMLRQLAQAQNIFAGPKPDEAPRDEPSPAPPAVGASAGEALPPSAGEEAVAPTDAPTVDTDHTGSAVKS